MLDRISKQLHAKAVDRAAKYLVAEADLLSVIIEVDQARLHEKFGEPYLTPYCVKYLNLSSDVAAMFVRVARKSLQVPALKLAVHQGLQLSKAKTIASVIDSGNSDEWILKAQTLTKEKLEREVASANPSAPKPEKAKPTGPDRVRIEFEVTFEEAEILKRARDLMSQKKNKNARIGETFVTALADWVERHDPVRKAERAEKRKAKAERTQNRKPNIEPAQNHESKPERHRSQDRSSIPSEIIHQVNLRDQRACRQRMPDGTECGSRRWTDIHHIVHKQHGGADTLENLITLCRSHHRRLHASMA